MKPQGIFGTSATVPVVLLVFSNLSYCNGGEFSYSIDIAREVGNTANVNLTIAPVGNDFGISNKLFCSACEAIVPVLSIIVKTNKNITILKEKFLPICSFIQDRSTCEGLFDVYGSVVIEVLRNTKIGPKRICNMLGGDSCSKTSVSLDEWNVTFPNTVKPPIIQEPLPETGKPKLKVLHLTDLHWDPEYVEGTNANCKEKLCCRNSSTTKPLGVIYPAGRWGAYNCDLPERTIDNALGHIASQHPDIDYIIWTGDSPPHDSWLQTRNGTLDVMKRINKKLKLAFPQILILPSIGNHELVPSRTFAPPWVKDPQFKMAWLLEELYKDWKDWIPISQKNNFLENGFYSIQIRPKLKIISLNTIYCYNQNWWLYINSTDPGNHLQWLIDQLNESENNNEKVHIIVHVPPGNSDCLKTWSSNYYKIVNRYESTIKAQFFGHIHSDEYQVFYDTQNPTRVTNIAYVAPSMTSYKNVNPAYRIYYIDGNHNESTWETLDHETWVMDMDAANQYTSPPQWMKCYTAKDAYGMSSLRPSEWSTLIKRMALSKPLFDKFYMHYNRNSPTSTSYTLQDKVNMLCNLRSGKYFARRELCADLPALVQPN
ncbi:hypothetical protein FQA39_LY02010 [Lamprigera yunnana]|nr:hypothetical protein FQA39_LY02010 [Lamprigera yunnana]